LENQERHVQTKGPVVRDKGGLPFLETLRRSTWIYYAGYDDDAGGKRRQAGLDLGAFRGLLIPSEVTVYRNLVVPDRRPPARAQA
jgi:hypothetical protein